MKYCGKNFSLGLTCVRKSQTGECLNALGSCDYKVDRNTYLTRLTTEHDKMIRHIMRRLDKLDGGCICIECGASVTKGDRYCSHCGCEMVKEIS